MQVGRDNTLFSGTPVGDAEVLAVLQHEREEDVEPYRVEVVYSDLRKRFDALRKSARDALSERHPLLQDLRRDAREAAANVFAKQLHWPSWASGRAAARTDDLMFMLMGLHMGPDTRAELPKELQTLPPYVGETLFLSTFRDKVFPFVVAAPREPAVKIAARKVLASVLIQDTARHQIVFDLTTNFKVEPDTVTATFTFDEEKHKWAFGMLDKLGIHLGEAPPKCGKCMSTEPLCLACLKSNSPHVKQLEDVVRNQLFAESLLAGNASVDQVLNQTKTVNTHLAAGVAARVREHEERKDEIARQAEARQTRIEDLKQTEAADDAQLQAAKQETKQAEQDVEDAKNEEQRVRAERAAAETQKTDLEAKIAAFDAEEAKLAQDLTSADAATKQAAESEKLRITAERDTAQQELAAAVATLAKPDLDAAKDNVRIKEEELQTKKNAETSASAKLGYTQNQLAREQGAKVSEASLLQAREKIDDAATRYLSGLEAKAALPLSTEYYKKLGLVEAALEEADPTVFLGRALNDVVQEWQAPLINRVLTWAMLAEVYLQKSKVYALAKARAIRLPPFTERFSVYVKNLAEAAAVVWLRHQEANNDPQKMKREIPQVRSLVSTRGCPLHGQIRAQLLVEIESAPQSQLLEEMLHASSRAAENAILREYRVRDVDRGSFKTTQAGNYIPVDPCE